MAKGTWYFESPHPWQVFGESFRQELSSWKPNAMQRALGFSLGFRNASDITDPFKAIDAAFGIKLDVIAEPKAPGGKQVASYVRLTLGDAEGGYTRGQIDFWQAMGALGKDLGDYAKRSVLAVDPNVRFESV